MILRPAGLLVRQGRLLLMGYCYDGHDRFNLPGGKLDPGETLAQCLVREWQEELGLVVTVGPLALVVETAVQGREVLHLIFHLSASGEPVLNAAETSANSLLWQSMDQLAATPLYPAVGQALQSLSGQEPQSHPCYLGRVEQPWLG